MRTLVIARHGETVGNVGRWLQGQTDSPLTPAGVEQARLLGVRLAPHVGADTRIVASDTGRALRTATLALPDAHIETDVRLREMHFGRFEGLDHDACMAREAEAYGAWLADPLHAPVPEGEMFADLSARVLAWLADQPETGTTIAVTHGGPGMVLLSHFTGLPFRAAWTAGLEHGDAIRYTFGAAGVDIVWLSDLSGDGEERSRRRIADARSGTA